MSMTGLSVAAYQGTPAASVTSGAISTAVSNSSFWVGVAMRMPGNAAAVTPVITDSKGNTYTQVGTLQNDGSAYIATAEFLCTNGVGGAGHTFTAAVPASASGNASSGTTTTLTDTTKAWTTNQWVGYSFYDSATGQSAVISSNTATVLTFPAISAVSSGDAYIIGAAMWSLFVQEIVNGNTTTVLDQATQNGGYAGAPYTRTLTLSSGTVTYGALLVSIFATEKSSAVSIHEDNGYTVAYAQNVVGFNQPPAAGMAYKNVAAGASGAYPVSWEDTAGGGGASSVSLSLSSFIGASAPTTPVLMGQICL